MTAPRRPRESVTFRLDADKRAELDAVAEALDRDRSYLLNEAVGAYLEVHRWQLAHIREGVRQADAGEFASDEEVAAAFDRWKS
jgi:predicted transcriptional regulator